MSGSAPFEPPGGRGRVRTAHPAHPNGLGDGMRNGWMRNGLLVIGLGAGLSLVGAAQSTQAGPQMAPATPTAAKKHVRRRRVRTQTIPVEAMSPARPATTQPSPQANAAAEAQQGAADARLLQQQQAQSDKAARINDEQVRRAQQRQDAVQNEVRIQDAPGPAQTGVLPGTPAPQQQPQQTNPQQTNPQQTTPPPGQQDQRIQDQPSAVPGQNTTPPQD